MKRIYKNILSILSASAMLWLSSCRDDTFASYYEETGDEVQVSFTISPEAAAFSTRADYPSNQYKTGHIGDGSKVDMLIYAVYDEYGNLLEDYCNGTDSELENKIEEHGKGQTIKYIKDGFPYTVNITLKKGVDYKIAFWAQSSNTNAYDTRDLKKVAIRYSEITEESNSSASGSGDTSSATESTTDKSDTHVTYAGTTPNNDEFRDAFCRSVEIKASNNSKQQNVYLYRPLSQINVGTSGYDYEIVTRDAKVKYTHSKIRINRAASYLDVVNDKTLSSTTSTIYSWGDDTKKGDVYLYTDGTYYQQVGENPDPTKDTKVNPPAEAFAVVDFGYAPLPAYSNYREQLDNGDYTKYTDIPKYPSFTKWDWEYNHSDKDVPNKQTGWKLGSEGESKNPFHSDMEYEEYSKEEFLNVNLYSEGEKTKTDGSFTNDFFGKYDYDDNDHLIMEGDEYLDYANYLNYNDKKSETFKYLSMCYILTASTKEEPRVINNVKVWLASDEQGTNEYQILDLNYVPAQRNWRTNIVGELLTAENTFEIKMDQNFGGNINAWKDSNGTWEFSGPLSSGVYYDAEKDEIQISSAEGLVWFQRMVNGTMVVREAVDSKNVGKPYKYYTTDGSSATLNYKGISEPSDGTLKERILRATHQIYNDNPGWPTDGNFHFVGKEQKDKDGNVIVKAQATVKLVADIDLTGMEWIPIGFEGRMGEQLGWTVLDNNAENIKYGVSHKNATNRIFYGIFDGNGHTIANLSTKRFTADVHEDSHQKKGFRKVYTTDTRHPADNPQWFGYGLFGQIGGDAKVNNVRLNNVDILGYNGVSAVVAIAYGGAIEISNNVVDGGSIICTPLYRGDSYNNKRSFARGVYMGGIVGYFNTDGGKVDNNTVRNVYMKAVRRSGGLIGSLNQQWLNPQRTAKDEGQGLVDGSWKKQRETNPASISNNRLENIILMVSTFAPYGEKLDFNNKYNKTTNKEPDVEDNVARAGFGYNTGNLEMYAQKFVGGYELEADKRNSEDDKIIIDGQQTTIAEIFKGNTESNVTFAKLPIYYNTQVREGTIEAMPLKYMPMLSTWFCEYVNLNANFFGEPSAHTVVQLHDFQIMSGLTSKSGYKGDNFNYNDGVNGYISGDGTNYYYPIDLPYLSDIDYIEESPKAGVFVESVTLDGKGGIGGRSVITPIDITGEDDCVMYITARNRHQFGSGNYLANKLPDYMAGYQKDRNGKDVSAMRMPTVVKNVVLRGEPWANTGILMAPNKNMHRVELDNVAIYDVYKTLALYNWGPGTPNYTTSQKVWPNWNQAYDALRRNDSYDNPPFTPFMIINNCNLRGYTIPGSLWDYINYTSTTFERGSRTGHGSEEYTCKVETTTTFTGCFFKAPFIIDLSEQKTGSVVTFKNSVAASTASLNCDIKQGNVTIRGESVNLSGTKMIKITSDAQGYPIVSYYNSTTMDKANRIAWDTSNPSPDYNDPE